MMSPENSRVESSGAEMSADNMSSHKMSPSPPDERLLEDDECRAKSPGDVAKFDGKIVYNPDGSAYIIEDCDLLDDEDSLQLPKQEGSIVELPGRSPSSLSGEAPPSGYPQIANAFYISRSSAYYNALYGGAYAKLLQGKNVPETPVVHSYRVHSARRQNSGKSEPTARDVDITPSLLPTVVPVKPILMCFICKLSFSCAKSFGTHCVESHAMEMTEEEKQTLLESENSSAIIQSVGKDKEVTLSFLEPVINTPSAAIKPPLSPGAITNFLSALASTGLPLSQKSSSSQPDVKSEPKITMLPPSRLFPDSSETRLSPPSISPADTPTSHLSGSPSPVSAMSSLGSFPSHLLGGPGASNSSMLQGTTIGACPDHINGRPTGVECSKCDLILNSSRLAGGSSWNMSRNSCKTLKCPKCNWHYKYQETLEIHMKEKHPESETTCIYCITGQQHPRLARGETYTCGYKPYRCEVCNYSTTTKGNLSIHMQSDKHLNNIQDLQNGTPGSSALPSSPVETSKMPQSPVSQRPPSSNPQPIAIVSPSKLQQPAQPQALKPNWRCDVCNYETNVARNLRIHMTSEKHTHNMMALQQQNAKSLQQLSALHMASGLAGTSQVDPKQFLGGLFGSLPPPPLPNPGASSEAALADLAFNQAVLAQLMAGGQLSGQHLPPLPSPLGQDFNFAAIAAAMASSGNPGHPSGLPDLAELAGEPPSDAKDPNPRHIFTCCVCRCYSCDNIDDLSQHLAQDRSRTRENEVSIVIGGNYLCHLCNYRTNLKANFQLHCKTDKHLQRLSHVNHIKEGGPENEWKLRFITSVNPVDLRCNACDFQTNSPHKIQVHVSNQQHQVSSILFSHLQRTEEMMSNRGVSEDRLSFDCALCKFTCRGKVALMSHVRTVQHLQMEQIHQLQKRAEGNSGHTDIGEIFQVVDNSRPDEDDDPPSRQERDDCDLSSSMIDDSDPVSCPLCQEKFERQSQMEMHAMSVHSVNQEGLERLQSLMNGSHWLNQNSTSKNSSKQEVEETKRRHSESDDQGDKDSLDEKTSSNNNNNGEEDEDLADGQKSTNPKSSDQSASGGVKKSDNSSSFSYSLEKYLDPNRPFKCDVCKESFTQKNILLVHYNSVSHLHKLKKLMQEQQHTKKEIQDVQTPEKSPPLSKGSALEALLGNIRGEKKEDEEAKLYKCNICKVAYSQGSTLDIHLRSVLHQGRASKLQELILTGQIDMSKPLIEQPDQQQLQEQQKKLVAADMLSPKSLNSTGSSNPRTSPNMRGSSSPTRESPQSSPLANLHNIMASKVNASPSDPCSSSDESAFGNLQKTFPFLSNFSPPTSTPDKKGQSPVLKNLLQNYGFDLVKQFNELQKKTLDTDNNKADEKRVKCPICMQPFSNLWLVKGHADEVHKDQLSQEIIDRYIEKCAREGDENGDNKDRSTPSSVHSEGRDKDNNNPHDREEAHNNLTEMQEAFQRAMMNAQIQQMNPLLMQMAQLQGINPLLAMNIHPPLISPNLLKQGPGVDMPSAILAQLQNTHQLFNSQAGPMGLNQLFAGLGGMDPKLLALMSAARPQQSLDMGADTKPPVSVMNLINQANQSDPKNLLQLAKMGMSEKQSSEQSKMGFSSPSQPPPPPSFSMHNNDNSLMHGQGSQSQEKRARTRITDDQLKILRSNFDINNSPAEDQLNKMSQQTGLPLKVIKHWFRNTLFKERQKNKDSPYNFNNPPSTKLNLEEYEKTGEPKVTQLNPDEQAEYHPKDNERGRNDSCGPMSSPEPPVDVKPIPMVSQKDELSKLASFERESALENSNLTLSRLLSVSQLGGLPTMPSQHNPLLPSFPAFSPISSHIPTTSASSPMMPDYLNSLSKSPRPMSPSMSIGGSGKRANRTRFTDYQIKVLQEFFENNAYPKDDDLEYLSKLLGLSPRVIVVWFQNARQKARKIYENQPPPEQTIEEDAGRFTRTAGCNYQCKKCLLVFQRYYELIRHQKQHCFKEEDAKRSAQAQKAAAQAAAQFTTPGSHQTLLMTSHSEDSKSSIGDDRGSVTSPVCSTASIMENAKDERQSMDDRNMFYRNADMEDTLSKFMQQHQMPSNFLKYPATSAFGMLQQQALHHHQQQRMRQDDMDNNDEDNDSDDFDSDSIISTPSSKRKLSEDGDHDDDASLHQKEKRLRTTILPEQLDFLYQKYAQDSNPSRKMLEQIAGEVGLRKRVVQVWFQNTRARERKGQFRTHAQLVINKRCPFCPEIFKMRTALEAHLATFHPSHPIGTIDIDALPSLSEHSDDEEDATPPAVHHARPTLNESPFAVNDHLASLIPNSTSAFDLQNSMRKYYEDTMKRFMNDINEQQKRSSHHDPLDLSLEEGDYMGDGDSDANKSMETESNGGGSGSICGMGGGGGSGSKRFRTQMSGLQVKMMKSVFEVYKTPTMTECSNLGRDIGLQKRVVQVWFQNARAKEKRAKLQLQQAIGREPDQPPQPEECTLCNFKYGPKFVIQDHIFAKSHLEQVKLAIEHGRYDPESPGFALSQTAAAIQSTNGGHPSLSPNPTPEGATSLSMLQMTTQVNNGHELMELSSRQNSRMLMQV